MATSALKKMQALAGLPFTRSVELREHRELEDICNIRSGHTLVIHDDGSAAVIKCRTCNATWDCDPD